MMDSNDISNENIKDFVSKLLRHFKKENIKRFAKVMINGLDQFIESF